MVMMMMIVFIIIIISSNSSSSSNMTSISGYEASVAEWLERAVTAREVSDSFKGQGSHINLYGRKRPADYVIFREECQKITVPYFYTHGTKPRTTLIHLTNRFRR